MDYFDLFHLLERTVNYGDDLIPIDRHVRVITRSFRSQHQWIVSGATDYRCPTHGVALTEPEPHVSGAGASARSLDVHDIQVSENHDFRYHVFLPASAPRVDEVIFLFHGLNEKYWHKYFPWAYHLAANTGKGVILFPIAFHMNRAPMAWSDRRLMHRVCAERRHAYPEVIGSTLSNAAISTRLQARPQRFIWSGLQSYYDVHQLIGEIAAGAHPQIDPWATYDFFAYSIGCLLAQILLMTDASGRLAKSRMCLFCGGAVLNHMSPVSRVILDSECNVALYSYAVEHLESHLRRNERLRHFLGDSHPEGLNLRSMLNYNVMRREREECFRQLGPRILAIALESDQVVPEYEVRNALQGAARDLPSHVEVLDLPYPHRHEDPFPMNAACRGAVDHAARQVLGLATDFLTRQP